MNIGVVGLVSQRFPPIIPYTCAPMLLFKKKFIELIRNGEKTQTIRLWDRVRMRAGQRSYIPGIGYISILSVEQIELERLTDTDAVPDGFATAELLRDEIRSIYADELARGQKAFRVRFRVFPPREQKRIKEERRQRKEREAAEKRCAEAAFVEKALDKLRTLAGK